MTLLLAGILGVLRGLGAIVSRRRGDEPAVPLPGWTALESHDLLPQALDVTVVVPYYNPGPRLIGHVAELVQVLRASGLESEIIAVSDGTVDGSDEGLEQLGPEVRVVRLASNMGKGMAIRVGLSHGRGAYLGFIDGDGDIPASVFDEFVATVRGQRPDFVIGSKRHPNSKVVYPPLRRFYSWGYQLLTRVLFGLDVSDTQAGVKLVSRDVLLHVLPVLEERGFTFDLELLAVARRFGFRSILELPVEIRERFTSSISPSVVWEMLVDTATIAWRLHVSRAYDKRRPYAEALAAAAGAKPGPGR